MKKWIPVVIVFLLMLTGVWFWSLSRLPKVPEQAIMLREVEGLVSVKQASASSFQKVTGDTELEPGSSVRTDTGASATIDFYGLAESTIDENSELTVEDAALQEETGAPLVKIALEKGGIWSRVLHILDLDGGFSVQTSDVVATVRGTSFDVAADKENGTYVRVADAVLETSGDEEVFVPEGTAVRFVQGKPNGEPTMNDSSDEWYKMNRSRDLDFRTNVRELLLQRAGADDLSSSSLMRDMARASEAVRMKFASEERKDDLAMRYTLRRFAYIRFEIDHNRQGVAGRELTKLKEDVLAAVKRGGRDATVARKSLYAALPLFFDVDPTTEAYSLKQQLEELAIEVAVDEPNAFVVRLTSVQSRLDEAKSAFNENNFGEAEQILDLAAQARQNVERELTDARMDPNDAAKLRRIMRAIEIRLANFERELEVTKASARLRLMGHTNDTIIEATSTAEGAQMTCEDLRVTLSPDPIEVGQLATVTVAALFSNGTEQDVTGAASLSMNSTIASLVDGHLHALSPGTATLNVAYDCLGQRLLKNVSVRVTAPIVPEQLLITPPRAVILPGESVALKAEIRFSNGILKDVTANTIFKNSSPMLGTLSLNRFVAGQEYGTAKISAEVTEGGKMFTATSEVDVVPAVQ